MVPLHDILRRNSQRTPRRTALIAGGRRLDYRNLWGEACRWANWLSKSYVRGTRIGILLPNTAETVCSLYGISAAGLISVPLDDDLHPSNLKRTLIDCRIPLLITTERHLRLIGDLGERLGLRMVLTDVADTTDFDIVPLGEIRKESSELNGSSRDAISDTACLLHTTGTTGSRKAVMLTHANLAAATENILRVMGLESDVVESIPLRLSHSFGFGRLRAVFAAGGTAIIENGFLRAERMLHRMRQHGVNAFSATPAGFVILMEYLEGPFRLVAPRLKYIEIGSDFMRVEHKRKLMELCPNARIFMHYGLTEASRAFFLDFRKDRGSLETAGRPAPEIRCQIDQGCAGAPRDGRSGEILLKGPMVTSGYWENPNLTGQSLEDGWLRTGDFGFLDESGYLHLQGRRSDIINLGGMKVAPREVEEVLQSYPGIKEAVVLETASSDLDALPSLKAYLVLDDADGLPDLSEIKKHCLEALEAYKTPREYEFVASLPRSSSGKVRRQVLKEPR